MKGFFKDRFNILGISFVLFGIVVVFQLVNLQIIHGEEYDNISQRKLFRQNVIPAQRGNILDRYGVPIAVSRVGYTAEMIRAKMTVDERNEMILKLVGIFEKNGDKYVNSLSNYLTVNPFEYGPLIKGSEKAIKKWKEEMAIKEKDIQLMATPKDIFDYMRYKKFEIDEKYSEEDAYKIMCIRYEMLMRGCTATSSITLAKDIKVETVAEIEERHMDFPGVTTGSEPYREYIDGEIVSNVIGYVGPLDDKEYKKLKDEGYKMNDIIGKVGIELSAESYLKGKEGLKKVEVDTSGRQTEELETDAAIPGNDVILTLDMKLQKIAMESLEKNIEAIKKQADGKKNFGDAAAGAAVAMDVNTGEILAMASYPSYDPSVYLADKDDKEAQKKKEEYSKPPNGVSVLMNRATQGTYEPGSTFKPLVGVAGLEEGVITPNEKINDKGTMNIYGMIFKCLEYRMGLGAHGPLDLAKALETSCNIYFHELGKRMGIDKMVKWGKLFGLGQLTGIDIPGEAKGILASKESKEYLTKLYSGKAEDWYAGDTLQAAIGQSYNLFTPLQLATYTSALANGGKKLTPHLIKRVVKYDESVVLEKKTEAEQIPVKKENLDAVRKGMEAVIREEGGTAVNAFRNFVNTYGIKVAGKTGTAETGGENSNKSSNALFICYAPAEKPQIAVAVVIEHGAWGANTAPIAVDILMEYFGFNGSNGTGSVLKPDEVELTR